MLGGVTSALLLFLCGTATGLEFLAELPFCLGALGSAPLALEPFCVCALCFEALGFAAVRGRTATKSAATRLIVEVLEL